MTDESDQDTSFPHSTGAVPPIPRNSDQDPQVLINTEGNRVDGENPSKNVSKAKENKYFMSFQEFFSTVKVYREVMDILRGQPSQSRKCHMIEIEWMRRFQAFGRACEKVEA